MEFCLDCHLVFTLLWLCKSYLQLNHVTHYDYFPMQCFVFLKVSNGLVFESLVSCGLITSIFPNYPQVVRIFQDIRTVLHLEINPSSLLSCSTVDWWPSTPALVIYWYKPSGWNPHTFIISLFLWVMAQVEDNWFSIQGLTGLKSRWWPGLRSRLRHVALGRIRFLVVIELRPTSPIDHTPFSAMWSSPQNGCLLL